MPFQETCRLEERVGSCGRHPERDGALPARCGAIRFMIWRRRRDRRELGCFLDRSQGRSRCSHRTELGLVIIVVMRR